MGSRSRLIHIMREEWEVKSEGKGEKSKKKRHNMLMDKTLR
jgi:hypothetical protein